MSGGKLSYVPEHRSWSWHIVERKKLTKRFQIHFPWHAGILKYCLDLGTPKEHFIPLVEIKGLDANPVAGQNEFSALSVPNTDRKHPIELLEAFLAEILVSVDN